MKSSIYMAIGVFLGMWHADKPASEAAVTAAVALVVWLAMDVLFWLVGRWWRTRGLHA